MKFAWITMLAMVLKEATDIALKHNQPNTSQIASEWSSIHFSPGRISLVLFGLSIPSPFIQYLLGKNYTSQASKRHKKIIVFVCVRLYSVTFVRVLHGNQMIILSKVHTPPPCSFRYTWLLQNWKIFIFLPATCLPCLYYYFICQFPGALQFRFSVLVLAKYWFYYYSAVDILVFNSIFFLSFFLIMNKNPFLFWFLYPEKNNHPIIIIIIRMFLRGLRPVITEISQFFALRLFYLYNKHYYH